MNKDETYSLLLSQIEALISGESNRIANLANIASAVYHAFDFWWTGFYLVEGVQLTLGPFQGPVACTRIPFGRGVCGTAWKEQQTIVVPDVEQFEGHIACSSESKSEIVVPIFVNKAVVAVLDIDSKYLNTFDNTDKLYLERLAYLIEHCW